ncbi:16S rRNA (guanine(966)-N(2))-methyltransferase RsmD [Pseudomonadota bacterium]
MLAATTNKQRNKPGGSGQLRIIGGEWRGRKLSFPDVEGLRPTADRVRETLFNWLQMKIPGARCLDLFAGSGALGLEALSRGAAEVVMVEQDRGAAQQIRAHLQTLNASQGHLKNSDAFHYLKQPDKPFDIVFLDPPYKLACIEECCHLLVTENWLNDDALIYIEDASSNPAPKLPSGWTLTHNKKAGEIGYYLAKTSASS